MAKPLGHGIGLDSTKYDVSRVHHHDGSGFSSVGGINQLPCRARL